MYIPSRTKWAIPALDETVVIVVCLKVANRETFEPHGPKKNNIDCTKATHETCFGLARFSYLKTRYVEGTLLHLDDLKN